MKTWGIALTGIAAPLVLMGCRGKVVTTAALHGAGSADATFTSTGKPVVLWADTDGAWQGGATTKSRFPAHYEVDVFASGSKLGHLSCDTSDSSESVCGSRVSVGTSHHGDCEYKLSCAVPTIPAGAASIHVVGTPGSGVTSVNRMSLNVREQ